MPMIYVCIYVCVYVCMYVCMNVCMNAWLNFPDIQYLFGASTHNSHFFGKNLSPHPETN